MKQKQKLNHVYFIKILLPSHFDEAKMKLIKGMLQRNIEHFLKKRKYEKIGFSEMSYPKKIFLSISNDLF